MSERRLVAVFQYSTERDALRQVTEIQPFVFFPCYRHDDPGHAPGLLHSGGEGKGHPIRIRRLKAHKWVLPPTHSNPTAPMGPFCCADRGMFRAREVR